MALILWYAHLNPNDPALSHRFFQVPYVEDTQDWNQPFQLFKAMFKIYNLASIIQNDGPPNLEGMKERIETLASDISKNFPNTLKSNIDLGLQRDEDVYEDDQVVDLFARAGYTLESNDEDEKGWAPLIQVKQRS